MYKRQGLTKRVVYENEEFNLLQAALNIEDSLEDLRYNHVIIATDADVDGMHIRLLMITFLLQFFPDLIKNGHFCILQEPLFRVRNKKETRYCYTAVSYIHLDVYKRQTEISSKLFHKMLQIRLLWLFLWVTTL